MTAAAMRSTRVTAASLAALVLTALVFIVWPDLDLVVAGVFARGGGVFVGDTALGRLARHLFEIMPFGLMIGATALYAVRRFTDARVWAPNGAAVAMLALSLALGPGLLVNVGLKDHSHRPRPAQVTDFGGTETFRPFYTFDGACDRNCSFVSGEGASAFWTLAPALLAPPPFRPLAIAAALVFGAATGLLRMAFGGHFLSDTIFAAILTWLVIVACWRAVATVTGRAPNAERAPARPAGD